MKVCYSHQMRGIDKCAIEDYLIPGIILMEHAASKVVESVTQNCSKRDNILIFCGTGNNGGDGFAIARQLNNLAIGVTVALLGNENSIQGDALVNYNIINKLGIPIIKVNDDNFNDREVEQHIKANDLIIDAIFGTGLSREITGFRRKIIELINISNKFIISVDIPSGVNSDNGKILGVSIKADITVTFEVPKVGLLLYPGAYYAGTIKKAAIGIPRALTTSDNLLINVLTDEEVKDMMPERLPWSNKGTFGKVTIIAGSKNMTGAALLSGRAAYKTGAGLVRLVIPTAIQPVVQSGLVEAITIPYSFDKLGILNKEDIGKIGEAIKESSVIVIGPGLGQEEYARTILEKVLEESGVPIVIDADGLNILSKSMSLLKNTKKRVVITPHIGEMSRLVNKDIDFIKDNIINVAVSFSSEYNVICVLKDARTVIAYPDGNCYINTNGNDGMATAGSGDVLTGIIASLIAQGLDIKEASRIGVYLHGKAGDLGLKSCNKNSLMASDICESLGGIKW